MASHSGVAELLKFEGPLALSTLAVELGLTYEAVRQVIEKMEVQGFVERSGPRKPAGRGRPAQCWRLTVRGEHLFPKKYDELSDALLTAMGTGPLNGHYSLLAGIAGVKALVLTGEAPTQNLQDRLEIVRKIYGDDDVFLSIKQSDDGIDIIEHNCPYLNVALAHPALCSVTTNVMSTVLDRQVVRTETFQEGSGRCVFRVLEEKPSEQFVLEA